MRVAPKVTSLLAALAVIALPLEAQDRKTTISGSVLDGQGQPIAGAEVFAGRTDKPVTTNDKGQFRIDPAPSGRLWISARKIGYGPVRGSVTVNEGENQAIELIMEPLPVNLPEIKVVEKSGMKIRRLEDFWRRSRTGYGGRFVTREDIERRNPIALEHVVRTYLPFAALARFEERPWDYEYDYGFRSASMAGGRFSDRCAPAVAVDGGAPLGGWRVADFPISEVEAVEIYKPRWSEIPIEYSHYPRARQCGLVVVWRK